MHPSDDVVDRSAEEGVRVVGLGLLADADDAARRLHEGTDPDALHDFRVGLRRARTALRAFRPWLGERPLRKLEKKLKRLAKATNAQRDAEVQIAWLETKRDLLAPNRRGAGLEYLIDWIRTHADEADAQTLVARYHRASQKLARKLGTYTRRVEPDPSGQVAFGATMAALLRDQLDVLRERIDAIRDALDEKSTHSARIAGKRLRYLLEPLRGNRHADTRGVVKHLKELQDVLGDLHDAHVLAHEIEDALASAEAERARRLHAAVYGARDGTSALHAASPTSPRHGLLAILELVRERRDALFADLDRTWRHERIDMLGAEVHAIESALEARAGGKLERERKYLLAALPPHALESPAVEIDQGWLPGAHLRERIRRVADADGEHFWRGLKQGTGEVRVEAEEETTGEVFAVLWSLTEGRRVSKRRRKVSDAGLVWEIDEFTDRELVLAEVELPAGAGGVALPEWLRPLVQREVTDDPAFGNEALAAAHGPPAHPEGPPSHDGSAGDVASPSPSPASDGGDVMSPS